MQRLDLNLSTRPFRNNTLIWAGYGLALALLLGFATWNGTTFVQHLQLLDEKKTHLEDLAAQQADLEARERAAERERERRELALENLTIQSLKANEVIEWKAFSWTELFNRLETALPWNVYMSAVRPVFRPERGRGIEASGSEVRSRPVAVEGYAKSLTALLDFERQIFASEYFDDPEPLRHAPDDRGDLVFTMRFTYFPDGRPRRRVIDGDEVTGRVASGDDAIVHETVGDQALGDEVAGEQKAGDVAGMAADARGAASVSEAEAAQPDADPSDWVPGSGQPVPPPASEKDEASSKKAPAQEVRP